MRQPPVVAEVYSVRSHRIRLTFRPGRAGWVCDHRLVNLPTRSGADMDTITIDRRLIPLLLQLPSRHLWVDFDEEGDVLYLSFEKPQQATDSPMGEDGNVYHRT